MIKNLWDVDFEVVKKIENYLSGVIKLLHAQHYARLNKGGRCAEINSNAALYLFEPMVKNNSCISLQLRWSTTLPEAHEFLLISPDVIPLKESITDFKRQEQENIFLFDAFTNTLVRLTWTVEKIEKYLHYQGPSVHIESKAFPMNCIDERVLKRDANTRILKFFNREREKLLEALTKSRVGKDLPNEYMCEGDSSIYRQIVDAHPVQKRPTY